MLFKKHAGARLLVGSTNARQPLSTNNKTPKVTNMLSDGDIKAIMILLLLEYSFSVACSIIYLYLCVAYSKSWSYELNVESSINPLFVDLEVIFCDTI